MTIQDDIAKAREMSAQADALTKLQAEFPDIQKYTGRWNKVAYFSKTVNARVDRFDMRHNCGCCQDSPLELWPYLETPHGNVYSDPPKFFIGERDVDAGGDRPSPGWKEELRKASIPEPVIGAVAMHFKRCRDSLREELEERLQQLKEEDDP